MDTQTEDVGELCVEILRLSDDGDHLAANHLRLVEIAANGWATEAGVRVLRDIHADLQDGQYVNPDLQAGQYQAPGLSDGKPQSPAQMPGLHLRR